jgi:hypothetical protein
MLAITSAILVFTFGPCSFPRTWSGTMCMSHAFCAVRPAAANIGGQHDDLAALRASEDA